MLRKMGKLITDSRRNKFKPREFLGLFHKIRIQFNNETLKINLLVLVEHCNEFFKSN